MSRFTRHLLVLALSSGLLFSLDASASRDLDQDEVMQLVREGKIRPLTELMALNPERFSGHLLDVEVEYESGRLVYEIEMLDDAGNVREFYLDPVTGAILKEEIEDD